VDGESSVQDLHGHTSVRMVYASTMLVMVAAFVLFALDTWHQTHAEFERELDHLNKTLAHMTEAELTQQASMLRVIGRRLEEVDAVRSPQRGRKLIDQMMKINPEMAAFGLADTDGQLLLVSGIPGERRLPNLMASEASRDGFAAALNSDSMVVGRTYHFPLLQRWIVPVRLALRDAAGEVSLVMTAGIDIDARAAMWSVIRSAVEPFEGIRLSLIRDDGYIQLQLPARESERHAIYGERLHGYVVPAGTGTVEDPWGRGDLTRALRLQRVAVTAIASVPPERVRLAYLQRMSMPVLLFLAALMVGWLFYLYLRRNQQVYEMQLVHDATHDALTALPNRLLLEDRVNQDILRARRRGLHVAVMYVDLDQFKRVNDGFGHKAGDRLLQACARRLRGVLRDGDTVGRLSGDEFLVVFPDLPETAQARGLAARIIEEFRRSFDLDGRELFSTVSIGVALFPHDGDDADQLLQNADAALYQAKSIGRNSFCFFEPRHNAATERRIALETALRTAIERNELSVVYQPKADGTTLEWHGAEALLRWHSPTLGDVSPGEFIPVAEEIGLIDNLGWFVIETVLRDLHWIRELVIDFGVAVNVSVRQLHDPGFIPRLLGELRESGLPPGLIELEVTESIMAEAVPQLETLREAGLRLAIDDFGTGFSCLSYLKRLPVTTLKLDREFVRDLEVDPADKALITAMIAVARELDLETVAEGVETQGQLAFLQAQKCSQIQGFLLGKPMPIARLLEQIRARGRRGRSV
jgi:diguanylate cyclase (GGDEF)-like protein